MIEGIRRFKTFLLRGHFELVTDNIGLGSILGGEAKSNMVHLWALEVLTLDYTVVHRAGRQMGLANALSRLGWKDIIVRNAINWDDEDAIRRRLPKTLTAVPSKRHGERRVLSVMLLTSAARRKAMEEAVGAVLPPVQIEEITDQGTPGEGHCARYGVIWQGKGASSESAA